MMTPSKAVPASLMVPGGAGVGYVTYKYASTPEEVRKIAELESKYGGCLFWFVKSKTDKEGWYKEQAIYASDLKSESLNKIEKLFEQLNDPNNSTYQTENSEIKKKCEEKKGGLVEIKWYTNKWSFDDGWGEEHKLAS